MAASFARYMARLATLPAGSPAAELLTARYTVSRYKAVFGGDLPAGWGMGIVEADDIVKKAKAASALKKQQKEDAKEKRREDKATKMAGKKRSREPEE